MSNSMPSVFFRQTTGLVRQLSTFDSFVFNASFVNVGLAVLYMVLYVPGWHPGGSMSVATLVAIAIAVPTSLLYGMLASVFPRSGGEYVYISRILGARWGVAATWNLGIWGVFYIGVPCGLFARYGVAPLFRYLGVVYKVPGLCALAAWITSGVGTFLCGGAMLAVIIALYIRGTRRWAKVQNALFLSGVGAILACAGVLLTSDNDSAMQRLGEYIAKAGTLDTFVSMASAKARELGVAAAPFSLAMTFLVLSWPCYNLFWCNASTYFGGEVRQPAKSQMISLPASVLFSGIGIFLLVVLAQSCFGFDVLGVLGRVEPQTYGLTFTPYFNELCAIISPSRLIGVIILVGFLYWCLAWAPVTIGVVTRCLLAWSLDGLLPMRLSQVSARLHTPVYTLIVCGVLGAVSLALFAFIPSFALLVGVFGIFLTFILTSVAGALLPTRRPELYSASPVAWRWGRFQAITVVGCLSVVFLVVAEISIVLDPVSGISLSPTYDPGTGEGGPFYMFLLNILVFVSGFAVYPVIRWIQRKRGIDIDLSFTAIPPE